jgi:heptaprenyl diphosphate synthase
VIYLQDIYVKLAKLKIAIEEKLTHPFLEKYIITPKIDEDKLLIFYAIFDEIDLPEDLKKSYIMTAMLVQIALDTHDHVTTQNDINSTAFVQRQLTALAGDYFSGLYYFMLSEVKDINMIRTLAVAIKEINEHKLRLYHDENADIQSIMDSLFIVETVLYQRVTDHLKLDPWKLISTSFLIYKRLSHEKFRCENETISHDIPKYNKSPFSSNYIKKACNVYFEDTASLLETSFFKTPAIKNLLLKRLKSIRFHETAHYKKTVEEGL